MYRGQGTGRHAFDFEDSGLQGGMTVQGLTRPAALGLKFRRSLRDTAMWCLHVIWALLGAAFGQIGAAHPQGVVADPLIHEAHRFQRQGVEPPPTCGGETACPVLVTMPFHEGNWTVLAQGNQQYAAQTRRMAACGRGGTTVRMTPTEGAWDAMVAAGLAEDEQMMDDPEVTVFMQTGMDSQWHELLEEIRLKLEGYGKGERSQTAGHLLRLLNHMATDTKGGRLLGHMTGRVASLTALLVAMWEDDIYGCKVPAGDPKLDCLHPTWERVTRFVARHEGSMEAAGKWPAHDMPLVMIPGQPRPSTPLRSPIDIQDSYEADRCRPQKRRVLQVEMSSGSSDPPRTLRMDVPLDAEGGTLQFNFNLGWEATEEPASPASTVVAPGGAPPAHTAPQGGMVLPAGAPFTLAFFGLSETEFEVLHLEWHSGELTAEEVARTHGPWVSEALLSRWGPPGPGSHPLRRLSLPTRPTYWPRMRQPRVRMRHPRRSRTGKQRMIPQGCFMCGGRR